MWFEASPFSTWSHRAETDHFWERRLPSVCSVLFACLFICLFVSSVYCLFHLSVSFTFLSARVSVLFTFGTFIVWIMTTTGSLGDQLTCDNWSLISIKINKKKHCMEAARNLVMVPASGGVKDPLWVAQNNLSRYVYFAGEACILMVKSIIKSLRHLPRNIRIGRWT